MSTTHHKKTSKGSGIFIVDDLHPEAVAMAQALYSRDPQSVTVHLEKIEKIGFEKFMGSFYVGYGHKSIGDCGSTTIFIENVSMLVAKAIQDWQLYNGQEASTRYLDMTKQVVLNPLGTSVGEEIQKNWMSIYAKALTDLVPFLKSQFPKQDDQDEKVYEKAIKAKAFDIARSLLPAGATTYVSWHTNLRQAHDHLKQLSFHPLEEVREVSAAIHETLKEKYASSFGHKSYEEQDSYFKKANEELSYFDLLEIKEFKVKNNLDLDGLMKHSDLLSTRPQKTELPTKLGKYGLFTFTFPLDFGSFRDLQRHRNCTMEMPLLSVKHGFYPWYLSQMPESLAAEVVDVINKQEALIATLEGSQETKQYYVAMGYTVACEFAINLPAAVYLAELRASQTVHPTLRVQAQEMTKAIADAVPGIALHSDMSPDAWNIKRGSQDIVKKEV